MGRTVVFVDTSVLCNFLEIPGMAPDRDKILAEFKKRLSDCDFVLPVTAVIETGNHVAQIKNGDSRRKTAQRFADLIRLVIERKAPWTLHNVAWDEKFLAALLVGASTGVPLVEQAVSKVGCGDLSILVERDLYQARVHNVRVEVWTLDAGLAAHC